MPTSAIRLALVVLLSGLAACSSSSSSTGGGGGGTLTVTALPTSLRANGTATSVIHVDGATKAPIKLATTRGTFVDTGTKNVTVDATTTDVTLQTCNGTDPTCTGSISVTAVDGAFATGRVQVSLVGRETVCNDGIDNNGDGNIDCLDTDCNALACRTSGGAAGTCQGLVCVPNAACVPTEATETTCNDGVDNDCKNGADCLDAACDGKQCGTAPTSVCQAKTCVDLAAGIGLEIAAARRRLPATSSSTTAVTVTVTKDGAPQAGVQVKLQTTFGTFAGAAAPGDTLTIATDANGHAVATFQATGAAGTAVITASPVAVPALSVSTQIAMPALGEIRVSSVDNPVMGVKFSGFNEQTSVSVLLIDTDGLPYPDGLQVEFEHQQLGGSEITQPWAPDAASTCKRASFCLLYDAVTASPAGAPDTAGIASLRLYSGTAAGPISLRVNATAGGFTRTYAVPNIAVVGAKASGSHVSVFCTPLNVPAFIYDDCTDSFYAGPDNVINCTVYMADRFNNVLGVATRAEFRSEAGSGWSSVLSAAYDPAKGGDQTADLGFAGAAVKVTGFKLPADVAPLAGEYSLAYPDHCGARTHNPRDGLNTVMVAVQGEEGFVDVNGNGVYDGPGSPALAATPYAATGEPFVDQGEPFVDENDNNVRDGDEYFIDVNQNGVWDGPNGVWDSNTVVWAEARVVYTGLPAGGSRWLAPVNVGLLPGPTPAVIFNVDSSVPGPATAQTFDVFFTDPNFNPISPKATYDIAADLANVDVKYILEPNHVDNLGMSFTQQFCDGSPAATPPTTPTACFSTCKSVPCYRVVKVGNFSYGVLAPALITGGGNAATTDTVRAGATIEGIKSSVGITGTIN